MKFKLDENLGAKWLPLFEDAQHEADTVHQENLDGATDETLLAVCVRERRCLVSLDVDFADVIRFSPRNTSGIALLRSPKGNSSAILERLIRNLLTGLRRDSIAGRLWIVEIDRIRIHDSHKD